MADRYRIDSEKMSLHPRRVAEWLEAKDDWGKAKDVFPMYVEVSPVGYCNHECTFCGVDYMLDRPDKPQLEPEVMKALLGDMGKNGVLSVMFAGAGEPLLYKPLADAILHADAVGIDTAITTNGVLLTEAFCKKAFLAKRLRWIKVSINAGDAETYAAIHRTKPEDFEKVLRNLEAAVKIRRELGSACTLGAQMVALPETTGTSRDRPLVRQTFPSNLASAEPLAKRLRDAGLDYLVVKPYSQHLMSERTRIYEATHYADAESWARALESHSTGSFNVVVRYRTMQSLEAGSRGYDKCHATPFHWAYVEADGEVWGCSAYLGRRENGVEYGDDRFRYGNVNEQSFGEIWRGERRKASWEYVRSGLDISECRVNCRMHHVNLYLEQVAHPGPHASFI
jgi:MoaA/NifB/PqqE/SkfB family radical SAM enzyme